MAAWKPNTDTAARWLLIVLMTLLVTAAVAMIT